MPHKALLLFALILATWSPSLGQKSSYSPGYVILESGDTLKGQVKDRSPEPFTELYGKIRFRTEGSRKTKKYKPHKILGYGFDDQHFISVNIAEYRIDAVTRYHISFSNQNSFLKAVERSPQLHWYEQYFVYDDNNYLDSIPFFYKPGEEQMVRVTQGILGFKKKRLAEYFDGCAQLIHILKDRGSNIKTVSELYNFYVRTCEN
jgi:hypothetical protein